MNFIRLLRDVFFSVFPIYFLPRVVEYAFPCTLERKNENSYRKHKGTERCNTQALQCQRFGYTWKILQFKERLQNIGVVYNRGIWHDETLTKLEPVKKLKKLKQK